MGKNIKIKKTKVFVLLLLLIILLPLCFSILFLVSPCYIFPLFGGDPMKWCNLLKGDPKLVYRLFFSGLITGFIIFILILYLKKDRLL